MIVYASEIETSEFLFVTKSAKHWTMMPLPLVCVEKRMAHVHLDTWGSQARFYIDAEYAGVTDEVFELIRNAVRQTITKHRPRRGFQGGRRSLHTRGRLPMELIQELIAEIEKIFQAYRNGIL